MEISEAKRLRALKDENAKLKRMPEDEMLSSVALRDLLRRKWRRPLLSRKLLPIWRSTME